MQDIRKIEKIQEKIQQLKDWKGFPDSEDKIFLFGVAKDIESLLDELKGIFRFCANSKKMKICEHMRERGYPSCNGKINDCKYWEWRGPIWKQDMK